MVDVLVFKSFQAFYSGKGMASGVRKNGGGYEQQQNTHIHRETDNPAADRTNLSVTIINRRLNELRVKQARHDRVIRKRRAEHFKVKQAWFLENTLSLEKEGSLPEVFLPPGQMLGDGRMRDCCFSDDGNWLYMLFEKRVKSLGYKFLITT
ncbi:hypothetical protein GCM10023116_07830 [Kistimonas scapharcae]|uniref:Transposase n=1 Tax=Kistimonas scapharcae TaxID=1036133 RepID=A0ABP8UYV1_9GAMM